jgi:hypothetical protein
VTAQHPTTTATVTQTPAVSPGHPSKGQATHSLLNQMEDKIAGGNGDDTEQTARGLDLEAGIGKRGCYYSSFDPAI